MRDCCGPPPMPMPMPMPPSMALMNQMPMMGMMDMKPDMVKDDNMAMMMAMMEKMKHSNGMTADPMKVAMEMQAMKPMMAKPPCNKDKAMKMSMNVVAGMNGAPMMMKPAAMPEPMMPPMPSMMMMPMMNGAYAQAPMAAGSMDRHA